MANRLFEAFQVLIQGGQRTSSEVKYDDEIPFIGSELDTNEVLNLIKGVKEIATKRKEKIADYEYMAKDGVLGSVLELIADECSVKDEINEMPYWVESTNKEFEKYINKWLKDVIKINTFSWRLAYDFAKYGEVSLRTHESNKRAQQFFKPGDWFELVKDPSKISELCLFGKTLGYQYESPMDSSDIGIYDKNEFIHIYRDLGECEYTIAKYVDNLGKQREEDVQIVYGTSFLESSRQAFMILDLLDTMLLSTRVNRSQLIRLIKTEVGAAGPKDTRKIISEVKQAFRLTSMQVNESYKEGNRNSTVSNVYIPIRNGKGETNVEELGGNADIRDIADIEYYTDKLIASTRVPKAFLGLDSSLTAGLGQNSLTRVDIRYARMIKSIKSLTSETVKEMVNYKKSKTKFNKVEDYEVKSVPVSTAEENEKYQAYTEKMSFVSQLVELLSQSSKVDADRLVEYVLDYMLDIPGFDRFFSNKPVSNPLDTENKSDVSKPESND